MKNFNRNLDSIRYGRTENFWQTENQVTELQFEAKREYELEHIKKECKRYMKNNDTV